MIARPALPAVCICPPYRPFCSHFVLDKIPIACHIPSVSFARGALMRRLLGGARCGACGREAHAASRTRVVGGHRPGPIRGPAASARLDVVRAKAGKPVGWLSCGKAPSTRKNGPPIRKNVAVARRKALRGSGLLAIQPVGAASSPLKCALRRATSPHVWRGDMLTPRTRKRREIAGAWLSGNQICSRSARWG